MTIGSKIFELRKKLNMSQEELADKVNVSRQTVSKWENDVVLPDVYNLKELSKVFHCTVDELIDDDREIHSKKDGPVVEAMKYSGNLVKRHWQKIGYYLLYIGGGNLFVCLLINMFASSTEKRMNVFNDPYVKIPFVQMQRMISLLPLIIGIGCLLVGIGLIVYDFKKMKGAK